jgi:hypothetical protein
MYGGVFWVWNTELGVIVFDGGNKDERQWLIFKPSVSQEHPAYKYTDVWKSKIQIIVDLHIQKLFYTYFKCSNFFLIFAWKSKYCVFSVKYKYLKMNIVLDVIYELTG